MKKVVTTFIDINKLINFIAYCNIAIYILC